MIIGIGGAGSKLAAKLDPDAVIVNVSESELAKVDAARKIVAACHTAAGQFRGSRKDPSIGRDAYLPVKRELLGLIPGGCVLSSTGGGTGNGIVSGILADLVHAEILNPSDKTLFAFVLPYPRLEPAEYVNNTIAFLQTALSDAIDSGNTGNIFLFSNTLKFESRLAEERYNEMLVESLKGFFAIPDKNDRLRLLDGHIDFEDFALYTSRPYFNYFTCFDYDASTLFADQLAANINPLLLRPDVPIEALFLLEVPTGGEPTLFYDILDHFTGNDVAPVYSVVENPDLERPFVTVSLLYSRKPDELLEDLNTASRQHTKAKVRKSLEQHVALPKLEVNMETEAKKLAKQRGGTDDDILVVLKRLGKL